MGQFVTECLDNEPKVYRATYMVDGEECIHYLCKQHAEMECFKVGLVKLESIVVH